MLSLAGISINANHVAPGDSLFDGIVIARAEEPSTHSNASVEDAATPSSLIGGANQNGIHSRRIITRDYLSDQFWRIPSGFRRRNQLPSELGQER